MAHDWSSERRLAVTPQQGLVAVPAVSSPRSPAPHDCGPMLAAPMSRDAMAAQPDGQSVGRIQHAFRSLGLGADCDAGYWRPTESMGEVGLVEAFTRKAVHRATAAAATGTGGVVTDDLDAFVLVFGRPEKELRCNFSNQRGERVDLSMECFQLSRSTLALRNLEAMHDDAAVTGRDVKQGLRASLPQLHLDRFYLVSYRDYSNFAVAKFPQSARRARLGTPKFVEMHFAVRVGQSAGVFIPITPAQFQLGWEKLSAMEISPTAAAGGQLASPIERWSLSTEQFRALGPLPSDLLAAAPPVIFAAAHGGDAAAAAATAQYSGLWYRPGQPTPSPWDFSPAALQFRAQRYVERQYQAVGRVVVKGAIVIGGVLLLRYALNARNGAATGEGRRGGAGRRGSRHDYDSRTVAEAFTDAALTMSPASFLRYMAGAS